MADLHQLVHAMTKADYERLDREGKITRPITWGGPERHDRTPKQAPETQK